MTKNIAESGIFYLSLCFSSSWFGLIIFKAASAADVNTATWEHAAVAPALRIIASVARAWRQLLFMLLLLFAQDGTHCYFKLCHRIALRPIWVTEKPELEVIALCLLANTVHLFRVWGEGGWVTIWRYICLDFICAKWVIADK